MTKAKTIGIILIIAGFFIPSVLYPFTTYAPLKLLSKKQIYAAGGMKYDPRFNDLEIVLRGNAWSKDKIALPYHYILAIGIVSIFAGISALAFSRREKVSSEP